jgi:DNA-directed RNA polymerase subunit RPC12/RpoP
MTKCPNCGAELRFSPEAQKMVCAYCMSEFSADEIKEAEKPIETDTPSAPVREPSEREIKHFEDTAQMYVCDYCGAHIVSDGNTAATECYYCHNPVTLAGRLSGEYRPDRLIPFKISREEAEEIFRKTIQKKWFVPSAFKSARQLEKMVGLYTPFWLADCRANAAIHAEAKIVTTTSTSTHIITNTKIFECDRAGYMTFERIPADGSKKLDDDFMDSCEPFNYADMVDFNMSYLQGFFADKYDVGKADILERIKIRAGDAATGILKDDINGYTSVNVKTQNINLIRTDWQYVMLPLWFMTFSYKEKIYQFAVNGQTGKVAGLPPMSTIKYVLMLLCIFCTPGLIGVILALLGVIG